VRFSAIFLVYSQIEISAYSLDFKLFPLEIKEKKLNL